MSPPPGSPPPGSPPPPFQPAPYQPQPGYGAVAASVTNQKAVISLVLSLVGLVCCIGIFTGPVAIFLGMAAQKEIDASGGSQGGSGLAKAGLIIGIVEVILFILGILMVLGGFVSALHNVSTTP